MMSRQEFFDGLMKLGLPFKEQELRFVMRRFEDKETNSISYENFVKLLSSDDLISELLGKLRSLVATASAQGHDVRECFEHFE